MGDKRGTREQGGLSGYGAGRMIPPDAHPYCFRCGEQVRLADESSYVDRYLVALHVRVVFCLGCGESIGREARGKRRESGGTR